MQGDATHVILLVTQTLERIGVSYAVGGSLDGEVPKGDTIPQGDDVPQGDEMDAAIESASG